MNLNPVVTDFDLPVYKDTEGKIVPQSVRVIDDEIKTARNKQISYKHWLDNVGFEIKSLI